MRSVPTALAAVTLRVLGVTSLCNGYEFRNKFDFATRNAVRPAQTSFVTTLRVRLGFLSQGNNKKIYIYKRTLTKALQAYTRYSAPEGGAS